jgi:hypothetical protein
MRVHVPVLAGVRKRRRRRFLDFGRAGKLMQRPSFHICSK